MALRRTGTRLRRQFSNRDYPEVLLRFEDGHEIRVKKGRTKTFDVWSGETIKIVAIYDPTGSERVLVASRRSDEFDAPSRDSPPE